MTVNMGQWARIADLGSGGESSPFHPFSVCQSLMSLHPPQIHWLMVTLWQFSCGKSPFLKGKLTITDHFPICYFDITSGYIHQSIHTLPIHGRGFDITQNGHNLKTPGPKTSSRTSCRRHIVHVMHDMVVGPNILFVQWDSEKKLPAGGWNSVLWKV